jgi:hypothetical protein
MDIIGIGEGIGLGSAFVIDSYGSAISQATCAARILPLRVSRRAHSG